MSKRKNNARQQPSAKPKLDTRKGSAVDVDVLKWATNVADAGGTVSAPRLQLVATLVRDLKIADAWSSLDRLWLHAAENSAQAMIDLVSGASATAVNSPRYTVDRGYAGNGSESYLDTGFAPSNAAGKFSLSSASMGQYIRTNRTTPSPFTGMGSGGGSQLTALWPLFYDGKLYASVSGFSAGLPGPPSARGMWVLSRTSIKSVSVYRNGKLYGTTNDLEGTLSNETLFVGGRHFNGTLAQPSRDEIAATFIGGGLNATKATALSRHLNAHMTAIGANAY